MAMGMIATALVAAAAFASPATATTTCVAPDPHVYVCHDTDDPLCVQGDVTTSARLETAWCWD